MDEKKKTYLDIKTIEYQTINLDEQPINRFGLVHLASDLAKEKGLKKKFVSKLVDKILETKNLVEVLELIVFTFRGEIRIVYNGKTYGED
jgi:arsenate reductase-like glutaredoxin family protein